MPARKSLYYDTRNSSVIKLSEKLPPATRCGERSEHSFINQVDHRWQPELVIIWPNPKDSRFRGALAQFNGRPIGLLV